MIGLNLLPWLRMPASGDVWQKVTNVTDWFSPKVEMNFAGDPGIEQEVNAHVASYGRQLGILTEAVLALADPARPGAQADLETAVARLKSFQAKVEAIKRAHGSDAEEAAVAALDRLKQTDPQALTRVIETFR